MRCLYCGKELALLKRWTGGGDFCSDGHRQQYQEEYNKLALTRLLQAKPQGDKSAAAEVKSKQAVKPEPAAPIHTARAIPQTLKTEEAPKPAPKVVPEPIPEPAVQMEAEEPSPAEPGFVLDLPVAVMAGGGDSKFELAMAWNFTPALPSHNGENSAGELQPAGNVVLEPSAGVRDSSMRPVERRLEVRDFVRTAARVEFNLPAMSASGLTDFSEEPMDILFFPHPPQASPLLWQETEKSFSFEMQMGPLARLTFGTIGFEDEPQSAVQPHPVSVAPVLEPVVEQPLAEVAAAPQPPVEPAPVAKASPPSSRPTFLRTPAAKAVEELLAAVAIETKPVPKPDPAPDLITKPLPVTLHGLAAGRGKPVQVFAAAVTAGVDLQIPRSTALPLRPVMVLGPAVPEIEDKKPDIKKQPEKPVVVKAEPKRPQPPVRPEPRFVNGKNRKPDTRVVEPEKQEEKVAVAAAAKEVAREAVPHPKPIPEIKKVETRPPDPKPAEPKPVAKKVEPKQPSQPVPYTSPDLGLPSLSMENSGNFWSRLPAAAKAGLALALVGAVIGVAMLGGKGKSAGAAEPQVVEAGTPLPAADSGWITDWGAEPGVRKLHDISVLRPSMSLSDYRIEFQAQIETKALGWIYRAKDGRNYYVSRLEVVKPGLDPVVSLVRFAVINGEEQARSQFPLTMKLHVDTLYKIRMDAVGDHFTTYVQGQKVDDWTDARIHTGGVGLYNERGERMSLKGGLNVVPLMIRK
jgi:hypothetical protein